MPACRLLRLRAPLFGAALLLLLALPAQAQEYFGELKIGMTASTFRGQTALGEPFDAIARFAGGFGAGYDFGNGFTAHGELLYALKGAAGNGIIETTIADETGQVGIIQTPIRATFEVAYLEIPLLLGYRLETQSRFHPKVFAGPTFSFRQDATVTFRALSGGPSIDNPDNSIQGKDQGFTFGAGVEIDVMREQRLNVTIRTTRGFSNVRAAEPALHNNAVLLLVGLLF